MSTMRMMLVCSLSLLVAVACEGSTTSQDDDGSGASSGSGASGSGGNGSLFCPGAPPTDGASCTVPSSGGFESAQCSWGDDLRPYCRTTALCQSDGTWDVTEPSATLCDVPPLPAACPSPPPASGTVCDDTTLSCWYDDGDRCWCSECEGGSAYPVCQTIDPPEWACASPPSGCPTVIPQAGDACSTEGLSCGPSCELEVICEDGAWVWRSGQCPRCAAPNTLIATPEGERFIADLRAGDLVYSVHEQAIVAVPLRRVASTPVVGHHVVRIRLDSGAVIEMSAGHPTADGRTFGELETGGSIDEHRIIDVAIVPYEHARTHDILPDSETGAYFAAGALVGSTLAE